MITSGCRRTLSPMILTGRSHGRARDGPLGQLGHNLTLTLIGVGNVHQIDLIELATLDVQRIFGLSQSQSEREAAAGEETDLENSIAPHQSPSKQVASGTQRDSSAAAGDTPLRTRAMPPMPEEPGPRREAWKALKQRFQNGMIPDKYTGAKLHKIVNQHIAKLPSDALEGRLGQQISLDTVLRAAGRRK
jgi:hypothetical protein